MQNVRICILTLKTRKLGAHRRRTERKKEHKFYAKQNVRQKKIVAGFLIHKKHDEWRLCRKTKFCIRGAQMPHDRSQRISNLDCLHMLVDSMHNVSLQNALFSYAAFVFMLRFVGSLLRSTTSMRSVLELALVHAVRLHWANGSWAFSEWNYCFHVLWVYI